MSHDRKKTYNNNNNNTIQFKVVGKKELAYHNHKGSLESRTESRFQIHFVLEHGWQTIKKGFHHTS